MKPDECQKYDGCNANLCPLDKDLSKCSYCDGEQICFYMREHVKGNRGDSVQDKTIHQMIDTKWEVIVDVGKSAFKKKLKEAESSPSKRDTENLVTNPSTISVDNAAEGSIEGGGTEKEGVFNAMIYLYSKASVQPSFFGSSLGH
ncbi:MAG: hypothetical protein IIA06_07715 [Proteobacteria bacterium]|nr:hypothetical protein [Pseudomonadota bacterium]